MIAATFVDWSPPALVGVCFTSFACLKLYGMRHNIVGGGDKPFSQRCMGSCPTWSRNLNVAVTLLFLVIGVANLVWAGAYFF